MMPQAVDDARRDDRSRCEGGENFHAETALRFRPHLHVHLAEYLRKDFHAMVVIDRKEFIVILLADLVSDDLPVDDGRHLVLALYGGWMYGYFADLDLPAVPFFPIPALALVEHGNIPSIDGSGCAIRHLLPELVFQRGEDFLLLLLVNPEKPDVPLNKNDAFQKVQKRRVQEKR